MANKIKCTCGHSWSKSSSSGKDMHVCHICGKDNTMKDGGWLSKYEKGGMVLEKKGDNYGKENNYNDASTSTGPDFVGTGYNTKGRNYSPAWGGQFQMGGSVPGAVGFTYARTAGSAPANGKYAKKTKASAQNGKEIPTAEFGDYFQSSGQASIGKGIGSGIGNMILPGIGGQIGGFLGSVAGNLLGGADDANKIARLQSQTKRNTQDTALAQGAQSIRGQFSSFMENGGEMKYYQNGLDWKPKSISKNGSVIKDDMGQWAHPGEITEIGSNNITMQGVPYPVLGVSDTGDTKMMQPGKDYKFKGSKVTEYPKGGWLNKYK